MNGQDALFDEIIRLKLQLKDLLLQHFLSRELFNWIWWFGVGLTVVLPVLWWKAVDKKRLLEICVYGWILIVLSTCLDIVGTDLALWAYIIHILPQESLLIPVDFIIVPSIYSIIYQKLSGWPKFLIACTIVAAVLSFLMEPFAIWIGEYRLFSWRLIYSFPIYMIINVIAKYVTERMRFVQAISPQRH